LKNIYKIIDILINKDLTAGNFILRTERKNIDFNPGQFFSIGIPNQPVNREYSVISGKDDDYLDFLIREIKGGTLSPLLKKLSRNEEIKILGPYGEFYLKEYDTNKKYIFIASGTGIAPFLSLIKSNPKLNFHLFHCIRSYDDLFLEYPIVNYNAFISREFDNRKIKNIITFKGRITKNLNELKKHIDNKTMYFLCGSSNVVNDIYEYLEANYIKDEKIFTELFF
jgi:ferredoxin--NADP+ reductase